MFNRLCLKCKNKVNKGAQVKWIRKGISAKLYWPEEMTSPDNFSKNAVFMNDFFYKDGLFNSFKFEKLDVKKVLQSMSIEQADKQIKKVSPVLKAIVYLFFFGKISFELFDSLDQFDQGIVRALLYFKDPETHNKNIGKEWVTFPECRRRTEENIKFIFNRAIKYVMKEFEKQKYSKVKSKLLPKYKKMTKKNKLIYAFYGYYFGKEATNFNKKINFFLLPKKPSMEKSKPQSHFTSISRQYLQLVSVSPNFLADIRFYLMNSFMKEILNDSLKKVQIILKKCKIVYSGKSNSVQSEANHLDFKSLLNVIKKTHMPWGHSEIRVGLLDLMKYLRL